jgi:DNA-binding NarL/FixJ family response regulator
MHAFESIKVRVVYGDPLVSAGLTATFRDEPGFELVTPATGVPVMPFPPAHDQAEVVVTDYEQGLAFISTRCSEARSRHEPIPNVLIVTQRESEAEIRHALERGVRGYLVLGCGVEEVVSAVRALHLGRRHIGAKAAQRLADSVACEALTGREEAVLRLVAQGHGNKAVASMLNIAIGTVKAHLKSIFQKLDASSRTEVAAVAERRGLLILARTEAGSHGRPRNDWSAGSPRRGLALVERHHVVGERLQA